MAITDFSTVRNIDLSYFSPSFLVEIERLHYEDGQVTILPRRAVQRLFNDELDIHATVEAREILIIEHESDLRRDAEAAMEEARRCGKRTITAGMMRRAINGK